MSITPFRSRLLIPEGQKELKRITGVFLNVCAEFNPDVAMFGSIRITAHEEATISDRDILKPQKHPEVNSALIADFHTAHDGDISPEQTAKSFRDRLAQQLLHAKVFADATQSDIYRNIWQTEIPEGSDAESLIQGDIFQKLDFEQSA